MNKARIGLVSLVFVTAMVAQAASAAAQCRVDQRFGSSTSPSSATYNSDVNANLGEWGSIFMGADTDTGTCLTRTRDFLKYKLKAQNNAGGWGGGLRGGDVFLLTGAALRLGTKGLLTSEIHGDILTALANYTFANWGGSCARGAGNGCMDDYTVAAAGHAWAGAYLWYTQATTSNGRDSAWFRGQAKSYLKRSVSPRETLCVRPLAQNMCTACSDSYNTDYDSDWTQQANTTAANLSTDIINQSVEVLSFEHGYENPSYGVGLLTSMANAVQGLELAGDPYQPSELQKVMAQGLFRTGQAHAPASGTACNASWLRNCVGTACSLPGQHCISGNCSSPLTACDDDAPGGNVYAADMFPVKSLIDTEYKLDPNVGITSPITSGYQFTAFCASRFSPSASFFHDGRYAAYYQIPYKWAYVSQPPVAGVNPVQHTDYPQPPGLQTVRSGSTTFSGWAFDGEGTLAAAYFSFTLDGQPTTLQNFSYGGSRTDVCNTYGLTNQGSCLLGWSGTFTPPVGFTTGNHVFTVTVRNATSTSTSTFQRTFYYTP